MRVRLRPGIHVLRRGDGRLQVGLGRHEAVVLPDNEEVRAGLRALTGQDHRSRPPASLLRALGPLAVPVTPATGNGRAGRPTRGRVRVVVFGHAHSTTLAARVTDLLAGSGWDTCDLDGGSEDRAADRSADAADVVLVVGAGEPSRELVDEWSRLGTPHVLVRLVEGYAVVGPFVAPGRTACLRCLDAYATDEDPSWPLLVQQYATLSARDRPDGCTEPVDPSLADLACAWAVRDVTSYLTGHRPSTWSTTVRLDPLLHDLHTTAWPRHPGCGCTWTMDP